MFGGAKSKLKGAISEEIRKEYGDSFIEDADYMLFFKGGDIELEDSVDKLFKIVNNALGKGANTLSKSDFKSISHEETSYEPTEDGSDEEPAKEHVTKKTDYIFVKITLN